MTAPDAAIPHYEGIFLTADDLRLFEQGWHPGDPPRALVVIVHGYAEHSGRYAHLAAHLVSHGYSVHTYDQRGYGRSEGQPAFIRSFEEYLDDLHRFVERVHLREPHRPLFLLGQSMGAVIGTRYILEHPGGLAGLVLCSPAAQLGASVPKPLQLFSPLLGSLFPRLPTLHLNRDLLSRDAGVVEAARLDPLNYHGRMPARTGAELIRSGALIREEAPRLRLPLLVLHGTADRIADPAATRLLYERAGSADKTLRLYDGLQHELLNEPERHDVMAEITAWLDRHLARPAG